MGNDVTNTYQRKVDFAALQARGRTERYEQDLLAGMTAGANCMVRYVVTPPIGASAATSHAHDGLHVHEFEQLFYILSGTMSIEVEGELFEAESGTLVNFPKGVPHRNWNAGPTESIHLTINSPLPDPSKPLSIPVPARSDADPRN